MPAYAGNFAKNTIFVQKYVANKNRQAILGIVHYFYSPLILSTIMKHLYAALIVLTACILGACGRYESEVKPLMGNETLSTFTALAEDGKTILTGVAQPQSGSVVVEPADYISVVGDSNVIICKTPADKYHVFKIDGEKLGVFDLFMHWTESADYYLGSKYGMQLLYFPRQAVSVTAQDIMDEVDVMLVCADGKWQVRDNFGKKLWDIPAAFTLIKDAGSKDIFVIAITEKHSAVLYDKNGTKLKTLGAGRWNKLQKKLENKKEYQGGTVEADAEGLRNFL